MWEGLYFDRIRAHLVYSLKLQQVEQTNQKNIAIRRFRRPGWRPNRGRSLNIPAPESSIRSIENDTISWIDIRIPTSTEIDYLADRFDFHELLLEDIGSRIQRPKIDMYDECMFVVMHFPIHDAESRINIAAEVDMIVGPHFFLTLHDGTLKPLVNMIDSVFESPELSRKLLEGTPGHLLYEVVDRLVDYTVPIVPKVEEQIERIEDAIFLDQGLQTVREVALIRRDLISLQRILKPQLAIVRRFESSDFELLHDDLDDYWGDISDHLARILDAIEDSSEVLEGLSDTLDKLMTQQMNDVIKTLTIISVVLLPLTLISGIFGMNVPLPYQESLWAYLFILIIMLALMVVMLIFFRSRRWI